jgi:hypothetical protein
MDVGGIVRWLAWGLAVVALLGCSGCLPASREWVREQLAPVQGQVAEVRDRVAEVHDRVAVVEEQFGGLAPKVDRILTQIEQRRPQSIASYLPPAGAGLTFPLLAADHSPGTLAGEANLEFTITERATPPAGGTTPPRPVPVKARKPTPPARAAHPDCLLKILKGEPC